MKLEVPFKEVHEFLRNTYHVNIGLKNIEKDKLEVRYFLSTVLTIKDIIENEVAFYYKANRFENIFFKGVHCILKNKLKKTPIEFNFNTKEATIDLNKVEKLRKFLKPIQISELHFVNGNIVLSLQTKQGDVQS